MPTWVTHMIIADIILKYYPELDRRGFCVGNIAPDCNVENEDRTSFTPSREVTHWMTGERKTAADCDAFYNEYIHKRKSEIQSHEHYSFLLGYYAHLVADAEFQRFIRNDERVRDTWKRIKADENLRERSTGLPEDWDSVKKLISKKERMQVIYSMEAEYLRHNPDSGYLTEILPLKEFPDYLDYLPHGCIVRKIGVMGYMPELDENFNNHVAMSREEFAFFIDNTALLVMKKFKDMNLI
ncbi:MAG: zinc dependent phospholipase C family protein [Clostridiaceae bacterium]|nr:zinc dependent phospholipase C family protein [Clostridiaceae bacterium]